MAYKVEVIRGATTYTLSDPGNAAVPFSIEEADLGGASIRNIEESGPYQDGATHLDERLEPDTITLRINVVGTSASALDGHRDTLNAMFKPVRGVPITLKLTRDDGEIRHLDTRRTGKLAIPLIAQNRPGNLHRAVVQLRAADPTWYNPTAEEETFAPPSTDWWLGNATIGSASVMTYVENPTQGQAWTHSGSVAAGSAWTIVFRTEGSVPPANVPGDFAFGVGPDNTVFDAISFKTVGELYPGFGWSYGAGTVGNNIRISAGTVSAGTVNYFMVSAGTALSFYEGTALYSTDYGTTSGIPGTAAGTARWRSQSTGTATSYWNNAIPKASVYNIALNQTQIESLNFTMSNEASGSAHTSSIAYAGDVDSYPVITITGPLANPVITNITTGDVLDFTGGTVGTAEIWIIDTRYGRKSALSGTTSVASYLSEDSDLSTFRLVPDPLATGGTNTIAVESTNAGTASSVVISYYNRYLSF